ncbi:putative ATP-binding cassette transporter [Apodospora peruviana]|uniref:ATP-binding cassette transporter n=1 Tax=Apodospora peruviana TaxID=516989 RepID=A0AAE0HVF5_9PEZI|nr:putative ATP-binding cassette transporter [Apodospora peruviana]
MPSESCSFVAENAFGPSVYPCWRQFDFTLLFEESFFQLLPSCIFILAVIPRLIVLLRRPAKVGLGTLYTIKLGALVVFSILELIILIFTCTRDNDSRTTVSIPSAAVSFLASLQLALISHFEHVRSYRPSFLIGLYLVVTLLLRAAMVRTYWFIYLGSSAVASTTLTALLLQVVILGLEHCSKRRWFLDQKRDVSTEEAAGFLARTAFAWLNRLLITGYRRPIQMHDLRIVDGTLASSRISEEFSRILTSKNYGRLGLIGMAFRCLGLYAFVPVIPRLCMMGFVFSQPFLASALISYLGSPESSANTGYGLIGASFLVYGGIAVANGWYQHMCWKLTTKIRGGLTEVINEKMLRLRYEKGVESKVLTLIIGDMQRIVSGIAFLHDLWASVIETSIGTWLLWRQVGPASLTVLAVALVSLLGSILIGKNIGRSQATWLSATERRLEATKSMLSSLKAIKMTSAGERVESDVERLRRLELAASKAYRMLDVATVLVAFATVNLAPVVVFGAYIGTTGENGNYDTARMFSSLILISLLANPLIQVFQVIPMLGTAVGCAKRVEEFLRKEEVNDSRSEMLPDRHERRPSEKASKNAIHHDAVRDQKQKAESHEVFPATVYNPIVSVQTADIGWDERVLLRNVNLEVTRGQHVAIIGPVGSGKTLMLQAILGEVNPRAGNIRLQPGVSVGYCTQTAWLENLSAENNAFRCAPNDSAWRERVIDACALRDLLDSEIPGTTIGSGGAKISGGEKQRLSLARAISSRPDILVLDDIFSAIDRSTKQTMLDRLFGPRGILTQQGTTVIQVVHDRHVAQLADVVVRIDEDGHIMPIQFSTLNEDGEGSSSNSEEEDVTDETCNQQAEDNKEATSSAVTMAEHANPASIRDRDVYIVYFGSMGTVHLAIFIFGCMVFAVTSRFPDIWVQWWTADAAREAPTQTTGYWIGLYAVYGTLPLITICVALSHLMLVVVPRSGLGLHGKLLKSVLSATFVFITGIDTGSIMNRFNQDITLVDFKLPIDLLNTISTGFNVTVQLVLVARAAVYSLAILPVLFAVLWIIQHFYLRTSKRLRQLDLEAKSDLHTKVSEAYQGIVIIRAHRWQRTLLEEFWEKLDRSQEPMYLLFMVQTWLSFVLNMIVAVLAVVVAGIAVAAPSKTSAGALGVAFINMTTLGELLTHVIQSWTSLETSLGAIARIEAFERHTPIEKKVTDPVHVPPEWPKAGALTLDHLSASYHPEHEKPVWSLQDVSLQIRAGEKVAVCGRSGSGKSTFLMSLLALIETPRGAIYLDDIDISRIPADLLRSKYFVISQDNYLQGETIRQVLDPDGNYAGDDGAINAVLSKCAILDKVGECGGLSGSLQEASLSTGETQLFALAKVILQAGAVAGGVVLFDEASSSIDTATEERIMKLIAEKLKGKTIVSVLHRLEAALEYDRILVLEKGRVAHFGTPAEIVEQAELFSYFKNK